MISSFSNLLQGADTKQEHTHTFAYLHIYTYVQYIYL